MRKTRYFGVLMALIPCMPMTDSHKIRDFQGIEGHVYLVTGNQMPSPDVKPQKPKGIKTTLYIYELTNLNQTIKKEHTPFYSAVRTRLIKRADSGKDGYFKVKLPVGQYSIFVKKDSLFFANWFDGNNNIAPVKIQPHITSKIDIRVDYDASY